MTRAAYHHGNLRQALIDEALKLLAGGEDHRLSLRELARRLGVTYAAPYHHFPDKESLLSALASEGFRKMADEMDRQLARKKAPLDPVERLSALGLGYVHFAIAHPTHYRLMFRVDLKEDDPAGVDQAREGCFRRLLEAVALVRGCSLEDEETWRYALICWSGVHGLASLWNEGAMAHSFGGKGIEELASVLTSELGRLTASVDTRNALRAKKTRPAP